MSKMEYLAFYLAALTALVICLVLTTFIDSFVNKPLDKYRYSSNIIDLGMWIVCG